jgi:hypothetical protein
MVDGGSAVSTELDLALIADAEGAIVPLAAGLSYSQDDPYAVRLDLHVGLDEPVTWVFARDLLAAGAEGNYGLGDVRVWPSLASRDEVPVMVLNIRLSSPHGRAKFEAPLRDVARFLDRSYELVPRGRESDHVDLDAALAEILRPAP